MNNMVTYIAVLLTILVGMRVGEYGYVFYKQYELEQSQRQATYADYYRACIDRGHPTMTRTELHSVCELMAWRAVK